MKPTFYILCILCLIGCNSTSENKVKDMEVDIYETSASGNHFTKIEAATSNDDAISVLLKPKEEFQTITGFGGSFTEASAHLLNQLGKENRQKVLEAYFGDDGARYSLTRTHINSCDFSVSNYSYAEKEGDKELEHFTIKEDMDDIIPMIKEAKEISSEGFNIISSPWTAPPWMKDNNKYVGGKLLPEYYSTWGLFFSKYIDAYKKEGIDIWGITVENEPLGNGNNWESMHYSAEEMNEFVKNHLGPQLEKDGHKDVVLLGYDQNRDELSHWTKVMYEDPEAAKYFDGTAVHWYRSTYDYFPDSLQFAHKMAPDKYLIQTEACVDSEVPKWKDDEWYWSKEATDWGFDWAQEKNKYLHPKYVPVYRYARDIIGCLNNWVDGWVDWNMVLDKQGGPNWFKNWCLAPVIVDVESDEVYYTPLYYTLMHFSKFIRPGAVRIGFENPDEKLMLTAAKNPDGSMVAVIFNPEKSPKQFTLNLNQQTVAVQIDAQAIQTVVFSN